MSANPTESDGNNPVSRSSQNKSQLLEAMVRNVPKLKELNYTQWKNIMTNSIKKAKLWGYVDGSIEEPLDHESVSLATYYDEAGAVRNAILGSLEPTAQKYLEEALDPREAWLALEKKYMTAESDADSRLVSIEQQLADLRLEEGSDVIEHIAEFCRMRSQLNGSRFAVDDQACLTMLYRSLPSSYRQSTLTPEGTEMKDFNTLCARLAYVSQSNESGPTEDYTSWGVPADLKALVLTGDKNPLLEERAAVTCRDCLLKDHKAGTPECPQYHWRKELWGETKEVTPGGDGSGEGSSSERPTHMRANSKHLSYEFSDSVKVVLDFDEIGLKPNLRDALRVYSKPSTIQQCAILPIVEGRNVLMQAPSYNGKTTALAMSILQIIDTAVSYTQALVFTSTVDAAIAFQKIIKDLQGSTSLARCSSEGTRVAPLAELDNQHIFAGTPGYLLGLINRNIICTRKVKIMVLDDLDKLIETGTENQILEVYRHVPPLAQVVASSATFPLSVTSTTTALLADPLKIMVKRNEGITTGTHFYVKVLPKQKKDVLSASFSALGTEGATVLCRDFTEMSQDSWSKTFGFYYMRESMKSNELGEVVQNFNSQLRVIRDRKRRGTFDYCDPVWWAALVMSDAALSVTGLRDIGVPLINYDVPRNIEDYIKRLGHWRQADPGQSQIIVTCTCLLPYSKFAAADTEDINVIQDLEQHYGIRVAELLWDEESKRLY